MKNTTVTSLGAGIAEIQQETDRYLGLKVSGKKRNYALTQFASLKQSPGILIDGDEIKSWYIEGVTENEGNTYFYGPYEKGRLLYDIIRNPKAEDITYLLLLAKALTLLYNRKQELPPINANSILFLSDQRILFLPTEIVNRTTPQLPEEERLLCKELLQHPDFHGEKAASFSLGIVAYLLLTGEFPFYDTDEEQLHEKMRTYEILSPRHKKPEIIPEISHTVHRALLRTDLRNPITLEEWVHVLSEWTQSGIHRDISAEERQTIEAAAIKMEKKASQSFTFRTFLEKNKITIILSTAGVIALIAFFGSFLGKVLEPPVTVGMEPREVVRLFYTSMNTLDHMAMQDCVANKVADKRINDVIQLFVAARMRTAHEGTAGIVDAEEWIQQGRPTLEMFETVFGVTELSITERYKTDAEARYSVTYNKFEPIPDQSASLSEAKPPKVGVYAFQENVYLVNKGKHWVISGIETVETTEVETILPAVNQ